MGLPLFAGTAGPSFPPLFTSIATGEEESTFISSITGFIVRVRFSIVGLPHPTLGEISFFTTSEPFASYRWPRPTPSPLLTELVGCCRRTPQLPPPLSRVVLLLERRLFSFRFCDRITNLSSTLTSLRRVLTESVGDPLEPPRRVLSGNRSTAVAPSPPRVTVAL